MEALDVYRKKRDFEKSPEPSGDGGEGSAERTDPLAPRPFVIQKHDASHLHYDFRLQLGGTLKSWAVPKGPSLDPDETRLAVEVEDHPLGYADFEGVIPEGQYGGGTVIVWDRGLWEPLSDPRKGLEKGKLKFRLHGEKLHGGWLLVRTGRGKESGSGTSSSKPQWLLRKLEDRRARPASEGDVLEERPESVLSGRSLAETAAEPDRVWHSPSRQGGARPGGRWQERGERFTDRAAELAGSREASLPDFVAPQLAAAVNDPPEGDGWLHEIKLDGYRMLARITGGSARLLSRQGLDWTERFAAVASKAPLLPVRDALLDGELVWLSPDGRSDFQALQGAVRSRGRLGSSAPLYYLAFDLLHLNGRDLTAVPLIRRKELLAEIFASAPDLDKLRFGDHQRGRGPEMYAQACRMGLEGILSKRADAPYRSGRSRDWRKVKCIGRQELVVVGYTESDKPGRAFRSLLVGYNDGDVLTYGGKVGTGYDAETRAELLRRLAPLERTATPLGAGLELVEEDEPRWVEPELVAEVAFTEWTESGVLRHGSFQGLRKDKDPREVVREPFRSAPPPKAETDEAAESSPQRRKESPMAKTDSAATKTVTITNRDKVLYPPAGKDGDGITKGEVADYFRETAPLLLAEIAGRPLSLLRCPDGIDPAGAPGNDCFYQKHLGEGFGDAVHGVEVTAKDGDKDTYLYVAEEDGERGIVQLAQLGTLEIHPWGSRVGSLDRPDRLIFDLDPDQGVGWPEVVDAARDLRDLLKGLGLASFPRLTGGKGVHLVIPIAPEISWASAKELTRSIGALLVRENPKLYTLNPLKVKRKGRIFIDYLRNAKGATAIASYSPRARPGAPVAVPIRWDELSTGRKPSFYHLGNIRRRLASLSEDPWGKEGRHPQKLRPEILENLTGSEKGSTP